ncbi:hypothetical protein WJX77_011199 [Trebouxia sp. C0004]
MYLSSQKLWEILLQVWEQRCLTTKTKRKQQNPARWQSYRSIGKSSPKPHRRNTRNDSNPPLPSFSAKQLRSLSLSPVFTAS